MMRVQDSFTPPPSSPCRGPMATTYVDPPSALAPGPEGRLHEWLREAAQTHDAEEILLRAAANFYFHRHRPPGAARPVELQFDLVARALADLAVTGRASYTHFRQFAPDESDLLDKLRARMNRRFEATPVEADIKASVRDALRRAYAVAWALRGPANMRLNLRADLGWIAVSGEDDPPHRPVNVPSAPYPQHEVTVTISGIRVQTRYMIAARSLHHETSRAGEFQLPPDEELQVPADAQIILFLHGHSSRLEEALELTFCLHDIGAELGRNYVVISLDLPCCGYASMFDHRRIAPVTGSNWHLAEDFDAAGSGYPILDFIDEFVIRFVDELDQQLPDAKIKQRIAAVVGGSLGGNLGLRLGRRDLGAQPWLRNIVSWSAASVWNSYADAQGIDGFVKGLALDTARKNCDPGETDSQERKDSRRDYFFGVFEDRIWDDGLGIELALLMAAPALREALPAALAVDAVGRAVLTRLPTQPEMWYRDGWEQKAQYIQNARRDRHEIYNKWFRLWHWRVACEQLLFSHWDPTEKDGPPRYTENRARTLFLAGEKDNYMFTNIFDATRELAARMEESPGKAVLLKDTGHSIHSERPHFLAERIAEFIGEFSVPARLAEASWTHAHDLNVEHPERLESIWRAGFYVRLQGQPGQHTWLHFAIPTPVLAENHRLHAGSVMIRYRVPRHGAHIGAVHVYDGEHIISAHNDLAERAATWRFQRFQVGDAPAVRWGLGVSVRVHFDDEPPEGNVQHIEFSAVGCDFLS